MTRVNTIEGLSTLNPKDSFWVIKGGNITPYRFAGLSPMSQFMVIGIAGFDVMTAKVFSQHSFPDTTVVLVGDYDSKEIGEYMVAQLEFEITNIKETYIKK